MLEVSASLGTGETWTRRRVSPIREKEAKRAARARCLSYYQGHSFWTSVARLLFPRSRCPSAGTERQIAARPAGHSPATDTTLAAPSAALRFVLANLEL